MSRTLRKDYKSKGERVHRDKSSKKKQDRKSFGDTSGTHSQWEAAKDDLRKKIAEESNETFKAMYQKRLDDMGPYPVKGMDYIKYNYGKQNKQTRKFL
jgi:hypothetical protein